MSVFSDLQSRYKNWTTKHRDYKTLSAGFIHKLAGDLATYIGAPNTYRDLDGSTKCYISAIAVTKGDKGELKFADCEHPFDAIAREEDGYWISAIRVTMDSAIGSFPKSEYAFVVRFSLRGERCTLRVHDEEFNFDPSDGERVKLLFDYIVSFLQNAFGQEPWEVQEKYRIGFNPPPKQ